jgi:hypothetical protein
MNALLVTMEDELSLVPVSHGYVRLEDHDVDIPKKPMQKYRSLLGALQKLQACL